MNDPTRPNPVDSFANGEASSGQKNEGGLSKRKLWLYGCAGGLISVLIANGILDNGAVEAMINGDKPRVQLVTLFVVGIATAALGGLWASLHFPVHSAMIALQLGLIAPSAVTATLETIGRQAQSDEISLLSSSANALILDSRNKLIFTKGKKPSTFKCIVRSIIRQKC